jgi:uncharacterized membrane protein YphA (DoxX/SURF4 family)
MFPTGMAGAALFVLRCTVVASLLVDGAGHWALVTSAWILSALVLAAIFLCLGLLTPYCAVLGCLIQLAVLFLTGGQNTFHLVIYILNSGVLAVLGPGAYSIDARLFGRRLLTVPPRR